MIRNKAKEAYIRQKRQQEDQRRRKQQSELYCIDQKIIRDEMRRLEITQEIKLEKAERKYKITQSNYLGTGADMRARKAYIQQKMEHPARRQKERERQSELKAIENRRIGYEMDKIAIEDHYLQKAKIDQIIDLEEDITAKLQLFDSMVAEVKDILEKLRLYEQILRTGHG